MRRQSDHLIALLVRTQFILLGYSDGRFRAECRDQHVAERTLLLAKPKYAIIAIKPEERPTPDGHVCPR